MICYTMFQRIKAYTYLNRTRFTNSPEEKNKPFWRKLQKDLCHPHKSSCTLIQHLRRNHFQDPPHAEYQTKKKQK